MTNMINHNVVNGFITDFHAMADAATKEMSPAGLLQLIAIHPETEVVKIAGRYLIGDVSHMAKQALAEAEAGFNVYVEGRTVPPDARGPLRGGIEKTLAVFALVADRDGDKGAYGGEFLAPTIRVETSPGNGHDWIMLDRAITPQEAQRLGAAMRSVIGADADTGNPTQPYRVAGTPNYPGKKKRERGRIDVHPTNYTNGGPAYTAQYLWSAVGGDARPDCAETAQKVRGNREGSHSLTAPYIEYELARVLPPGLPPGQSRSDLFAAAVTEAKMYDMSIDFTESLCRRHPDGLAAKYLKPRDRLRVEIERVWEKIIIEYGEPIIINSGSQSDNTWFESPECLGCGPQYPGSEPFDVSELSDDAPVRTWIVPGLIAEGVVNSLYGSGGVGKTLLAQQLAYYLVTAKPFLGIDIERKTSLCVLCEDDRDEIHRRHVSVKRGMGGPPIAGVTIWPRVGLENLLVTWNRNNEPQTTRQFETVWQEVLERRPDLLILDTVADLYGGNEIIRVQVNHFIKSVLGSLILRAKEAGWTLTVLLLAHPSMAGEADGTGRGGSTAWENAVRARLYMKRPKEGHQDERELICAKANYATAGEETIIRLLYENGHFVRVNDANEIALKSAKEHLRQLVDQAWRSKKPYVSKKGHRRCIHSLGFANLQQRGVSKPVAIQAIREMIEDGEIEIRKGHAQGYGLPKEDKE